MDEPMYTVTVTVYDSVPSGQTELIKLACPTKSVATKVFKDLVATELISPTPRLISIELFDVGQQYVSLSFNKEVQYAHLHCLYHLWISR